ncbi:MAG: hypothetical protein ABI761_01435 [Saprospiraceae bacterium]
MLVNIFDLSPDEKPLFKDLNIFFMHDDGATFKYVLDGVNVYSILPMALFVQWILYIFFTSGKTR